MKLFLLFFVAAFAFTGCVMFDSKVRAIKPSATNVESFSGTYSNRASYRSESALGFHEQEYLDEHLCLTPARGNSMVVVITVAGDTVTAVARSFDGADVIVKTAHFVIGKDCTFHEGYLVFKSDSVASGPDETPSLGYIATSKMRWTLDSQRNLVVVTRLSGAGFITIFPVAMTSKWMAIFPRIEQWPPQNDTK